MEFYFPDDRCLWKLERTRRLEGYSSPDYAIIDPNGTAVITAADKPFKVVYDSHKPVQERKKEDHREKGKFLRF